MLRFHTYPYLVRPQSSPPLMALLHLPLQSPSSSALNNSKNRCLSLTNFSLRCSLFHSRPNSFRLVKSERFGLFINHLSVAARDPVSEVLQPQSRNQEEEEFSRTKLIAQNVPWTCTVEDIRSLFEKHGKVLDVELSMHNQSLNRGLAFISMASPEDALTALNNLQSYELEGRALRLNYARARRKKVEVRQPKPPVTFNLFVSNLSYEVRAKDLREFFESDSSKVVSAHVIFEENPRRSCGYGFVSFKSKKQAEAALDSYQGKMFMGRPIRVERSKQFVKVLSTDQSISDEPTTDSGSNSEPPEVTDEQ